MKMTQKPNGFILIITLIFILLISLFAYQSLESMMLEVKLHQIAKNQKYLFDFAQKNLKTAEDDLVSHCSMDDQKNKNKCITVELISKPDHIECKIISKTFEADMTVILQSVCIKSEIKNQCGKRLSWEQLGY
jgi:Tfp pilus assembly protein PilX